MSSENTRISCIGTGAMGGAIMRAVCRKFGGKNITVTDRNSAHGKKFAAENGCIFAESNLEAAINADFVFLAVKPNVIPAVLEEIRGRIDPETVIISMAAGVPLEKLNTFAPDTRFIRIMPNVPAQIGQAMIALSCGSNISEPELAKAKDILSAAGIVEQVPETLMNCVTAVSGSAPAFVFMFIEALADAAVKCGMPRAQAYTYAAQTVKGSAQLVLESKIHPAVLKDSVCSPGGTTIDGVAALEENGFRNAVIKAVTAACEKSAALVK